MIKVKEIIANRYELEKEVQSFFDKNQITKEDIISIHYQCTPYNYNCLIIWEDKQCE